MKKSIIALSLVSILAGCGGGSGSSSGATESRDVTVSISTLEMKDVSMSVDGIMYGVQTDSFGYKHHLNAGSYKMCATDDRATYCEDFSIRDPDNVQLSFTLYGDAVITVSDPYMTGGKFQYYYTVSGSANVPADKYSVTVPLSNKKWAYVTVDNNEQISEQAPPYLSGNPDPYDDQPMTLDQHKNYYYMYVDPTDISAKLNVPLNSGELMSADLSSIKPNNHYAYKISHNEPDETHDPLVGVVIEDKWDDPKEICMGNDCQSEQ